MFNNVLGWKYPSKQNQEEKSFSEGLGKGIFALKCLNTYFFQEKNPVMSTYVVVKSHSLNRPYPEEKAYVYNRTLRIEEREEEQNKKNWEQGRAGGRERVVWDVRRGGVRAG